MALPDQVKRSLLPDTAATWESIAPRLPEGLYLGGGTGLAVQLAHRVSRDLDFFYHRDEVDLADLAAGLAELGPFAVTKASPGTLNGVFSQTKVQFLHADEVAVQQRIEETTSVGGIAVAGVGDLLAMKLKVIAERGELRDYFDVMSIELKAGRSVEEGLSLFLKRYGKPAEAYVVEPIVRALGYLADVDEDELVPASKDELERYWRGRERQLIESLSRYAS